MNLYSICLLSLLIGFQVADETVIKGKLREYDQYVKEKNTQAIVNLYTEDALYGDKIKGRKAIKDYLDTYQHINVIAYQSTTTDLSIKGNVANHEGSFKQIIRPDKAKLVEHTGTFRIVWTKTGGKWLIQSMTITSKHTR